MLRFFIESKANMLSLLNMLDEKKNEVDNSIVKSLMESMGEMLEGFSGNQIELQAEMHNLLEGSRLDMLTHEELLNLICGEQLRTNFLVNIFNGFKNQLENLFYAVQGKIENDDNDR